MITLKAPVFKDPYPKEGLIAEYLFNNNLEDTSLSNYDLENHGVTFANCEIENLEKCGVFDGTSYARAAASVMPVSSPLSVCFWYKTTYSAAYQNIINTWNTSDQKGFYVATYSGSPMPFTFMGRNASSSNLFKADANYSADGQWHFIAFTWTGDTTINGAKAYTDGILINQATASAAVTVNGANMLMGAGSALLSGNFYHGSLAAVRIFNKVLSASDIAIFYNNGKGI